MAALYAIGPAGVCALVLAILLGVLRYRARRRYRDGGVVDPGVPMLEPGEVAAQLTPRESWQAPSQPGDAWPVCPACGNWLTMHTVDGEPVGFSCTVHGPLND